MVIKLKIHGKNIDIIDNVAYAKDKELEKIINLINNSIKWLPSYKGYLPQLFETFCENIELLSVENKFKEQVFY